MIDESRPFQPVHIGIITISDTRTLADDKSGNILVQKLSDAGHILTERAIVKDDKSQIIATIQQWVNDKKVDVIITTGGTGVTGRDLTPEALDELGGKPIAGFGELFRMKSYQVIGTSCVQSRACAVVWNGCYIFALPGSPSACRDGWDWILASQLDIRHRPCNFVELLPRLLEK